jgi:hypothetical protein
MNDPPEPQVVLTEEMEQYHEKLRKERERRHEYKFPRRAHEPKGKTK